MADIIGVHAREILDSRGLPTLEVEVITDGGGFGRAAVPSGASTGAHEAHELRDGGERYLGKGVEQAVEHVNTVIAGELLGYDVFQQEEIDALLKELDGTENKKKLGANAILGVSLAVAKAAAEESALPLYRYVGGMGSFRLPVPLMNVLNGGAHANNGLDVQEFMIVPNINNSFKESLRAGSEIFQHLKKLLNSKGFSTAVGDEGGFAPKLSSNTQALELISEAVTKAGYKLGQDIFFALDVAATELFDNGQYTWEGKKISPDELLQVYKTWCEQFPIKSIEDGFAEDDWSSWTKMTSQLGNKVQIVGDDLFVTNPKRVQMGIDQSAANALLVKVNQIGSLSETVDAVKLAQSHQFNTIMSHRSGETEDSTIADLAVGLGSQFIKTGSLCRGERTAKYNQLLRIEEELGLTAQYWGSVLKLLK